LTHQPGSGTAPPSPDNVFITVLCHCYIIVDLQASVVIRHLGLVPSSNKVSSDVNCDNLIYGKRKPRVVRPRNTLFAANPQLFHFSLAFWKRRIFCLFTIKADLAYLFGSAMLQVLFCLVKVLSFFLLLFHSFFQFKNRFGLNIFWHLLFFADILKRKAFSNSPTVTPSKSRRGAENTPEKRTPRRHGDLSPYGSTEIDILHCMPLLPGKYHKILTNSGRRK
jgi:hypothetical protein